MSLITLHGAGLLVWTPVIANLALAVWAGVASARGRSTLGSAFWALLLLALAVIVIQAVPGFLLLLGGFRPRTSLHLLYAVLVALGGTAQFGLRPSGFLRRILVGSGTPFREPRVMALLCLTEAALLMRAWMTAAPGG